MENHMSYKGTNKLLVGVVLAVLSFWLFAQSILNMAPDVQADLGVPFSVMETGISLTALFSGLFIVVAGGLADKLGRVRFTYFGLLLNIVGSFCLIFSSGAILFILGRICQGLAAAFIMPATMSLVKTYYDGKERQRAVSFWSIGSWGGSGLCSFLGGAIASTLGWRYVFVFSILASLMSFICLWGTPESKVETKKSRFDLVGLVLFIVSMLALNIGIASAQERGLFSTITISLFLLMLAGLCLFYKVEHSKENAFIDFQLFQNRKYLGATLSNFLLNAVAGTLIVVNTYMQLGRGLSAQVAGELTLGYLACILVTIRIGERLLQQFGAKKPMVMGTIMTFLGISLIMFVNISGPMYLVMVFLGYAIYGIGLGIYATPSTDAAIATIPNEKVGAASGIYKMASSLGGAIGVAISIALFYAFSGKNHYDIGLLWGLAVNIVFCVLAFVSIMFVMPRKNN